MNNYEFNAFQIKTVITVRLVAHNLVIQDIEPAIPANFTVIPSVKCFICVIGSCFDLKYCILF